jgi:hypothetical protein
MSSERCRNLQENPYNGSRDVDKSYFVLRIKWPYLLTDSQQTYVILAHTWNVLDINFQKNPSNGTRDATEILRCSPSKKPLYYALIATKPN